MERVTGIGGVLVRVQDPERLTRWYADHLGVAPPPPSYDEPPWWQQAGPTVFAVMPVEGEHRGTLRTDCVMFGGPAHAWALNFRVADLDAMVSQLRGAGVEVEVDPETYPNGRFALCHDPEGNAVQLWQPDGADLGSPG